MNISEKIFSLRKKLHDHNYRYYVLDDPLISDYDFDTMLKELNDLEKSIGLKAKASIGKERKDISQQVTDEEERESKKDKNDYKTADDEKIFYDDSDDDDDDLYFNTDNDYEYFDDEEIVQKGTSSSPGGFPSTSMKTKRGSLYDVDDDFERRPIEEPFNDLGKRIGHAVLWPKMDYREFLENSAWGVGNDPYYSNLENAVENLFVNYIKEKNEEKKKKEIGETRSKKGDPTALSTSSPTPTTSSSTPSSSLSSKKKSGKSNPVKKKKDMEEVNLSMLKVSLEIWKKRLQRYKEENSDDKQIKDAEKKIEELNEKINSVK